jgi:hypothetical protein
MFLEISLDLSEEDFILGCKKWYYVSFGAGLSCGSSVSMDETVECGWVVVVDDGRYVRDV